MSTSGTRAGDLAAVVRGPLLVAGGIALGGVALSAVYRATGVGLPCPLRLLTGWDCPLCGGTRMGASLLGGDVVAAWSFNPVLMLGLVAAVVLGPLWLLRRWRYRGRPGPPVSRLGRWWRSLPDAVTSVVVIGAALGWALLRNLL